jgi:hypothetical protein
MTKLIVAFLNFTSAPKIEYFYRIRLDMLEHARTDTHIKIHIYIHIHVCACACVCTRTDCPGERGTRALLHCCVVIDDAFLYTLLPVLVLRISYVPEKVGISKEGLNQNGYSHRK